MKFTSSCDSNCWMLFMLYLISRDCNWWLELVIKENILAVRTSCSHKSNCNLHKPSYKKSVSLHALCDLVVLHWFFSLFVSRRTWFLCSNYGKKWTQLKPHGSGLWLRVSRRGTTSTQRIVRNSSVTPLCLLLVWMCFYMFALCTPFALSLFDNNGMQRTHTMTQTKCSILHCSLIQVDAFILHALHGV